MVFLHTRRSLLRRLWKIVRVHSHHRRLTKHHSMARVPRTHLCPAPRLPQRPRHRRHLQRRNVATGARRRRRPKKTQSGRQLGPGQEVVMTLVQPHPRWWLQMLLLPPAAMRFHQCPSQRPSRLPTLLQTAVTCAPAHRTSSDAPAVRRCGIAPPTTSARTGRSTRGCARCCRATNAAP